MKTDLYNTLLILKQAGYTDLDQILAKVGLSN